MPNKDIFINEAISEMFRTYNRSKEQPLSVEYNSFYSSVIRMLILIYGEDIVKCYENNDTQGFVNTILKFAKPTKVIGLNPFHFWKPR